MELVLFTNMRNRLDEKDREYDRSQLEADANTIGYDRIRANVRLIAEQRYAEPKGYLAHILRASLGVLIDIVNSF